MAGWRSRRHAILGERRFLNRPLASCKNPHFENEAKCTTFIAKISFIFMRMKNYFHIKGWALNLVLIQRTGWTRKWPIPLEMRYVDGKHSGSQQIGSFQTSCTLPITSAESEPSFSLMKWIKTCSGSTTPEERFSDLAVHRHVLLWVIRGRRDMPASLYTGSSKKALSCQSVWLNRRVKKKRQKNYRSWTVLLVLTNSVSNLTNLYLWNQNIETLRIQTLPSNSPPSPFLWPWDVGLELSYLQPPLWKNPGSTPPDPMLWDWIRSYPSEFFSFKIEETYTLTTFVDQKLSLSDYRV